VPYTYKDWYVHEQINPLNAELNPVCHLLALLGAHHILHVSRIRVKEATFALGLLCAVLYYFELSLSLLMLTADLVL